MLVSHNVNMPVTHTPVSSSSPAIGQVPRPLAIAAAWQLAPTIIRLATRSANVGRQRSSNRSPSTHPAPNPAVMIAHERAPSISCCASTGPTTNTDGSTIAW